MSDACLSSVTVIDHIDGIDRLPAPRLTDVSGLSGSPRSRRPRRRRVRQSEPSDAWCPVAAAHGRGCQSHVRVVGANLPTGPRLGGYGHEEHARKGGRTWDECVLKCARSQV